jgi:hypothetical protein
MRGKKIDTEFVSSFILNCASLGKCSSEEIISSAKNEIQEIDKQIKHVEELKIKRSKLLDVILSFDKVEKTKPSQLEKQMISFYEIKDLHIGKDICDLLKNRDKIKIAEIKNYKFEDISWCIKQLIIHKIVCKLQDSLVKGQEFDNFMMFVMKEHK